MYTPFGALILETEVGAEKMEKISLTQRSGFEVIHNSVNWRIAVHAYEEAVNGITAFTEWGVHEDSQEAFILLEGEAWLVLSEVGEDPKDYQLHRLEKESVFVVQKKEYHSIILVPDSQVLIMENLDMSNSGKKPVDPKVIQAVKKSLKK